MKVKLKVSLTGTRNGEDWPARGEVVDLPADEAAHMIAGGLAVPVDEPKVEKAAAPAAPESAAVNTKPTRRRA